MPWPKLEGSVRKSEQAPVGFKEQGQHLFDPAGEAIQDSRPVYTRISRKNLSLKTLQEFLDFDFDVDPDYVLVKRVEGSKRGFSLKATKEHTKLIREKRGKIVREGTSELRDDEPEYEWVRKRARRETKSPSCLDDHADKPCLCTYDGCDRAVPGNGHSHKWDLQDHLKRVYHDDDSSSSYRLS
ncbi:uncharacterized protein FFUJ_14291 [Fusarium fujikuroi IMI 58289]|uniref:C2H2-domain containing protein second zinc finger domain-containing protein n=1 Tax=Gibberella fujikuroi (strain CBS 195.34 / IMI 58289 / NRRL A-6831) TaxID=1279085 RepID=S0E3Y0_GIBF5|nr:uncharacterized protein FFUJ_14291 [Fusarium fujikuroi IMI 58289]CCT69400.1 uncharacterized protein FFUJ_14291 [Fusarium fujikuroi IMI 58289]